MDIIKLKEFIELGFTQRRIANEFGKSQGCVKHHLRKNGLKTLNIRNNKHIKVLSTEKFCSSCNQIKLKIDFYKNGRVNELSNQCKVCSSKRCLIRAREVKLKMIEYKGSECNKCSLNIKDTHPSVFEFHHINPLNKDINYDTIRNRKWDSIIKEIDKCILVCANCHRLIHAKLRECEQQNMVF